MPATQPRGGQILDGSVSRDDLNVATVGQAVVRKLIQGTGISLSSTGADAGTGDVTVSAAGGAALGVYSATIGDGSSTTITITQATHGRAANAQLNVIVYEVSSGDQVFPNVSVNNTNGTVTIVFGVAPASAAYRVVIIG